MLSIYSILIRVFSFFVLLTSFINKRVYKWREGRRDQISRIKPLIAAWENNPIIWIHAASLGEYEMSKPIIRGLSEQNSAYKFVISFFSPSGFENIELKKDRFLKIYLDTDIYKKQKVYLDLINPFVVIFIKYEFWFNFLRALQTKSIPYLFSSIHLNRNHYLLNPIFRPLFDLVSASYKLYAHNESSEQILKEKGLQNVVEFGDTRINQVLKNTNNGRELPWEKSKLPLIVFGSILNDEVDMVCSIIMKNSDYNFIIAPHDINQNTLNLYRNKLKPRYDLLSQIQGITTNQIVLVDTIGDLKYLYKNADIAYVGGGFDKGPHNVLEPVVFGVVTICGPHIHKFPMAQKLKKEGLLFIIKNKSDLQNTIENKLLQSKYVVAEKASEFVRKNKAKLDILFNDIKQLNSGNPKK